jgi:hyperosmotically inducible periplasmic protein
MSKPLRNAGPVAGFAAVAPRPAHELIESRQESQILTAYAMSPFLRAHDFNVTVCRGNVTLSGSVAEEVSRELARQIALSVGGIKSVDCQIDVIADYMAPARSDRGFGEIVDNLSVALLVKSKLGWSRHADAFTVEVESTGGKLTLSGIAETAGAKDFAGALAVNTPGVRSIDNQIVIDAGRVRIVKEEAADISDSWITAKVKATFMYSSSVNGLDIAVSTHHGVVTLSGKLHDGAECAFALELVRGVRGVKSVTSQLMTS